MNIQEQCVLAYAKHKHLKLAANDVNIPWQTVYVHLKSAGIAVTGDKLRYGSASDKLAARSESDFLEIVPIAEDQNRRKFQSKIDFDVKGYGVDVKAARRMPYGKKGDLNTWCFSLKKQELLADFFVCFAYDHELSRIEHVLLVPGEAGRHYTSLRISDGKTKGKWWDYLVPDFELLPFFEGLPAKSG